MTGDILMGGNKITGLPLPTLDSDVATKKYHDDSLPVGAYTEGARVYLDANQNIPNNTWTALAMNQELFDTDNIHDIVTNNSRLTCRTAGKYFISAQLEFAVNNANDRGNSIRLNGALFIAYSATRACALVGSEPPVATCYDLSVGDYVEALAFQNSGAGLLVLTISHFSPEFMIQRVG